MRLLAIETATAQSAVALTLDRQVQATATRVDRTGHGSFLVPAIDFCLDQAGWFPDDLDAIVVDIGPGHGATGGEIVFQGPLKELLKSKSSLTGRYLSGRKQIETASWRRVADNSQ